MAEPPHSDTTTTAGASSSPVPLTSLIRVAWRRPRGGRPFPLLRSAALPLFVLALLCVCAEAVAAPAKDGPKLALYEPGHDARGVKTDARERARAERRRWKTEQRRKAQERRERRQLRVAQAAQAASPTSATASYSRGVERWRPLVAIYFSGHEDEALYVLRGESGGDPHASNGTCRGLFQLHECHAVAFKRVTGLSYFNGVYDPEANARFAAYLSSGGRNWSAWSVRP